MTSAFLALVHRAEALCDVVQYQLEELAAAEELLSVVEAIKAAEMAALAPESPIASGSGIATSTPRTASSDNDSDGDTSVARMLTNSVKPSTFKQYARHWDKWVDYSVLHQVEVMPPDMRALEMFVADTAELSGSAGVANMTSASVAHFCALESYPSPFITPRFAKILRGIKLSFAKPVKPKLPFSREDVQLLMSTARLSGSLMDWRAALPLALCFQQLLRGSEAFDLNGGNVWRSPDDSFFRVVVECSKNHPEGFEFTVPIDHARSFCVGAFMEDYIQLMGIRLGDKESYFACKLATVRGVLRALPLTRVSDSTMRAACKKLIESAGFDPTSYASHSSKRGATREAMRAGFTSGQIREMGRWASEAMVARYAGGDAVLRDALIDQIRP
jgi:hypothetical protein